MNQMNPCARDNGFQDLRSQMGRCSRTPRKLRREAYLWTAETCHRFGCTVKWRARVEYFPLRFSNSAAKAASCCRSPCQLPARPAPWLISPQKDLNLVFFLFFTRHAVWTFDTFSAVKSRSSHSDQWPPGRDDNESNDNSSHGWIFTDEEFGDGAMRPAHLGSKFFVSATSASPREIENYETKPFLEEVK